MGPTLSSSWSQSHIYPLHSYGLSVCFSVGDVSAMGKLERHQSCTHNQEGGCHDVQNRLERECLTLPLPSCVTLGKLLNLPVLWFLYLSYLKITMAIPSPPHGVVSTCRVHVELLDDRLGPKLCIFRIFSRRKSPCFSELCGITLWWI